ncbi:MAG: ABC transporter permease subunit, partial [Candidatus Bathyarchaeia archaeon]
DGVINQLLSIITVSDVRIDWLVDSTAALYGVILADIWQWTPFMFLVIYAGLVALPEEPQHAARVFGASERQLFRHVTMPMLRNIVILALVLRSLEIFKIFDVPFFMTRGGPGFATETVSIYLYLTGLTFGKLSLATSYALIIMVFIIIATFFATRSMFRAQRKKRRIAKEKSGESLALQQNSTRVAGSVAHDGGSSLPGHSNSTSSPLKGRYLSHSYGERDNIRRPRRSATRKHLRVFRRLGLYLWVSLLSFSALLPIFWIVSTAFKPQTEWFARPPVWITSNPTFANWVKIFIPTVLEEAYSPGATITTAVKPIINSLIVAGGATILAAFVGFLAAYSISRYRTGGGGLQFFTLTTRMLPPIAVLIPLVAYFNMLRLFDTLIGLALLNAAISIAFFMWMMKSFIDELPREIEEAALLHGMSHWGVVFRIVLPLVKGGLLASALFVFIFIWHDFIAALTLTTTDAAFTIPVQLIKYQFSGGVQLGIMSALSTVAIIPVLIFGYIIHRHFVRGLTLGAVKGK